MGASVPLALFLGEEGAIAVAKIGFCIFFVGLILHIFIESFGNSLVKEAGFQVISKFDIMQNTKKAVVKKAPSMHSKRSPYIPKSWLVGAWWIMIIIMMMLHNPSINFRMLREWMLYTILIAPIFYLFLRSDQSNNYVDEKDDKIAVILSVIGFVLAIIARIWGPIN